MKSNVIIERYGEAFIEAIKGDKKVEELNNIVLVKDVFNKNKEIYTYLSDPVIEKDNKKKVIREILNKADDVIINFFSLLIDNDRTPEISGILDYLHDKYYELNKIEKVQVVSAYELNSKLLDKLKRKLEKKTGKTVEILTLVDESIIGGLIVKIGDTVTDMSIKKQLADIFG